MKSRTIAIVVMAAIAGPAISRVLVTEPATAAPAGTVTSPQKLLAAAKQVIEKCLKATQAKDVKAILATYHPKSPLYPQMAAVMPLLVAYDLNYKILSVSYFGRDKDYLAVRVEQETTRAKGPAFRDNVVDQIYFLRKDGNQWKIWQTAMLGVQFLHTSAAAPAPN